MRLSFLLTLGIFLTTPVLSQNVAEFAADQMIFKASPVVKYQGLILKAKILLSKKPDQSLLVKDLLHNAIDLNASDPEAYITLSDVLVSQRDFHGAKLILADGLLATKDQERLKIRMKKINELFKKHKTKV